MILYWKHNQDSEEESSTLNWKINMHESEVVMSLAFPTVVIDKCDAPDLFVKTLQRKDTVKAGRQEAIGQARFDEEGFVWVVFKDGSSMLSTEEFYQHLSRTVNGGVYWIETALTKEDYEKAEEEEMNQG